MESSETEFTIYGLSDPKYPDVIRYVGQTKNIQKRMKEHAVYARAFCHTAFYIWYRGMIHMKRKPHVHLLDTASTRFDSIQKETELVGYYSQMHGLLLNGCVHKKSRAMLGISEAADTAFIKLARLYFDLLKTKKPKSFHHHPCENIITILDSMCEDKPELSLWGYPNPWGWPTHEFCWKFPKTSLDLHLVSR